MKQEHLWLPMPELEESEFFLNSYTGLLSQKLQVNTTVLDNYLNIASLDGKVILKGQAADRSRAIPGDLNTDGSVSGRGSLRWGEKLPTFKKDDSKKVAVLKSVPEGWAVAINDDLLFKKIFDKRNNTAREAEGEFATKFNRHFTSKLSTALLRDKFTLEKDPLLSGRIVVNMIIYRDIFRLITNPGWSSTLPILVDMFWMTAANTIYHRSPEDEISFAKQNPNHLYSYYLRIINSRRRNVKTIIENIAPPLEIDRTIGALSYLNYQRISGNPIIRLAR